MGLVWLLNRVTFNFKSSYPSSFLSPTQQRNPPSAMQGPNRDFLAGAPRGFNRDPRVENSASRGHWPRGASWGMGCVGACAFFGRTCGASRPSLEIFASTLRVGLSGRAVSWRGFPSGRPRPEISRPTCSASSGIPASGTVPTGSLPGAGSALFARACGASGVS